MNGHPKDWPSVERRRLAERGAVAIASRAGELTAGLWLEAKCCAAWAYSRGRIDAGAAWEDAAEAIYKAGRL